MSIGRSILAGVAGTACAILTIAAWDAAGHVIWPVPAGLDYDDAAQLAAWVGSMSPATHAWIVAGFALGAFDGGLVAALLARRARSAMVVGVVVLLAMIAKLAWVAHPAWVLVVGVLVPLPFAWAGGALATKLRPPSP